MKEVRVGKCLIALVDDEDFEKVSRYKWQKLGKRQHRDRFSRNYASTKLQNGRTVLMHRFIMPEPPAGKEIDHKNGNGLDNRKENLRFATRSENQQNRRVLDAVKSSRFKGVYLHVATGYWVAQVKIHNRARSLGLYPTEEDAALAYDQEAKKLFGEFCRPNFTEKEAEEVKAASKCNLVMSWEGVGLPDMEVTDWRRKGSHKTFPVYWQVSVIPEESRSKVVLRLRSTADSEMVIAFTSMEQLTAITNACEKVLKERLGPDTQGK